MRSNFTISVALFTVLVQAAVTTNVTVRTRAAHNLAPKVWYRVPEGYRATRGRTWRTLVIFGGRNCEGEAEVSGKLGWARWADQHGVFLVAPGFKDDRYWEPQAWSGRALLTALAEIKKSYDIDTSKLLYYGYSAGSQASNLFAAWRPYLCRAWVSHACGVFHEPSTWTRNMTGLVTCGDADAARDILSRDFVAKARAIGQPVVWKSFPNHLHDVPPESLALARAFLAYWHETESGDLGDVVARTRVVPRFVGDEPEGVYWPAEAPEAANIPADDRIDLPDRGTAMAWGREGQVDVSMSAFHVSSQEAGQIAGFGIEGMEFLCRVPKTYTAESRVAVLFGGRNWPAGRTLATFGFDGVADAGRLFLLSPSFSGDDYWLPESGTGRVVCRAIDAVRRRYGLKPLPVVLYGYSAGGQCAALFADWMRDGVHAWGVHGCGVFPDGSPPRVPALVTCGEDDAVRLCISRTFACRAREAGRAVLARTFYGVGHELDVKALALARTWMRDVVAPNCRAVLWGEDDTWRVRPLREIDLEYRNPLYSPELAKVWQQ